MTRLHNGITYKTGDATNPDEPSLIAHICNNAGGWGAGFVMALSAVDEGPEDAYRQWYRNGKTKSGIPFQLGEVQLVRFGDHIVANMVAQNNVDPKARPPIDYDALRTCLEKLTLIAQRSGLPVVGPKFGSGIAGGDWDVIEEMIEDTLIAHDIHVTIFSL